jgi:hypothetical protein
MTITFHDRDHSKNSQKCCITQVVFQLCSFWNINYSISRKLYYVADFQLVLFLMNLSKMMYLNWVDSRWSRSFFGLTLARTGRGIHGLPKVSPGPCHARPLYALRAGHPPNGLKAVWGLARPQGGRPAAVFFHLGDPFPYGPGLSPIVICRDSRLSSLGGEFHDQGDNVQKWYY